MDFGEDRPIYKEGVAVTANDTAPTVRLAAICENVIEDKRDGTLSLIKIIDQLTVSRIPGAPPGPATGAVMINIVVVLGTIAGAARGERKLTLHVFAPDGTEKPINVGAGALDVEYDSDVAARNWIVRLALTVSNPGTFWIEARADGQPLTRMPLRIVYEQNSTSEAPAE